MIFHDRDGHLKSKRRRFYRIPGKPVKSAPFRHSNAQQSVDPLLGAYIGIDTECRFFYGMRNELLSSFSHYLKIWAVEWVSCIYSAKPYLVLIRSSFSSIGSAPSHRKKNVAMARTRSTGRPVT